MPIANHSTPIGIIRITEEDDFISSVHFLDDDIELVLPATPLLKLAVQQIDEYFAGDRHIFDFLVKQNGSDCQQAVWSCLLTIGYGKTISYARQSKLMNNTLAIR